MSQTEAFLSEIDQFLERTNMSPTAFGRAAVNDPNFVSDLKDETKPRRPSLGLVDRVHAFMRSHTSAGAGV